MVRSELSPIRQDAVTARRADRAGIDGTRPGKAWDDLGAAQRQQVAVKPFAGALPGRNQRPAWNARR